MNPQQIANTKASSKILSEETVKALRLKFKNEFSEKNHHVLVLRKDGRTIIKGEKNISKETLERKAKLKAEKDSLKEMSEIQKKEYHRRKVGMRVQKEMEWQARQRPLQGGAPGLIQQK